MAGTRRELVETYNPATKHLVPFQQRESPTLSLNSISCSKGRVLFVHVKAPQSCPALCNPDELEPDRLLCPWDSPSKNSGMCCCREPAWGTPPVAKVMRKEARHTQRWDRASGVPLEILKHLPPKPESAYFLLCALTYTSDFTGGCPPLPLSEKRVNLQLQLIKFLGVILFQPTNSFGSPLACLNRFFWPHVIVQSLLTVRGMRYSKLSKYRFPWAVKRLIRNCIDEGIFTCWANVCC